MATFFFIINDEMKIWRKIKGGLSNYTEIFLFLYILLAS